MKLGSRGDDLLTHYLCVVFVYHLDYSGGDVTVKYDFTQMLNLANKFPVAGRVEASPGRICSTVGYTLCLLSMLRSAFTFCLCIHQYVWMSSLFLPCHQLWPFLLFRIQLPWVTRSTDMFSP